MTWTSAVGRSCKWLLYKIVHGLALASLFQHRVAILEHSVRPRIFKLFGQQATQRRGIALLQSPGPSLLILNERTAVLCLPHRTRRSPCHRTKHQKPYPHMLHAGLHQAEVQTV